MNKRKSSELAFALITSVTIAACGSSASGPNSGAAGPSPGFVRQMQKIEGCLDLVKVMQLAIGAKVFKFSTKDMTAQPDGKPVSPYFSWMMGSVAHELINTKPEDQEKMRGEMKKTLDQSKQNGCQSISSVDDNGKPTETKILEANATRVVMALDHDSKAIYEIVADNELDTTQSFQIPLPHSCGNPDQPVSETHTSLTVEAMTWGDSPATPPRSANLEKLIHQGETQGNAPNLDSDDEAYCKAVKQQ